MPDEPDDAVADAIRQRVQVLLGALRQLEGKTPESEQWVCAKEAAGLSGFSDESIYRWAASNEIQSRREGGRLEIEVGWQAAVGLDPTSAQPLHKPEKNPLHQELLQTRIAEHKSRIAVGGLREALVRALLYVGTGRSAVDERGFEAVRRFRREQTQMPGLPLSEFKMLVREQFFMLMLDQEAALSAIPSMLPRDKEARRKAFENLKQVLSSIGQLDAEDEKRLSRVADLFEIGDSSQASDGTVAFPRQRQRSKGGQANNSGEDSTSRRDNAS